MKLPSSSRFHVKKETNEQKIQLQGTIYWELISDDIRPRINDIDNQDIRTFPSCRFTEISPLFEICSTTFCEFSPRLHWHPWEVTPVVKNSELYRHSDIGTLTSGRVSWVRQRLCRDYVSNYNVTPI